MLDAAQKMITQRLQFEFEKAEQDKNQALQKRLYEYKRRLEAEMRRKKAQSVMTRQVIGGALFIGGAVVTGMSFGAASPVGLAMMSAGGTMATSGNE